MMRTDEEREERPDPLSERRLWQRCRVTDAPEDEAARFLDLAAFADGLLDEEDRDRVAALVAADPEAMADVRAARLSASFDQHSAELNSVVARACAIMPDRAPVRGHVIPFVPRRGRQLIQNVAQWGSIAAAIAVASWLGFAMGSDTSVALSDARQASDSGFLPELFDPPSSFLRDLGEGSRT
jgi:anti-sigma factor RsiW